MSKLRLFEILVPTKMFPANQLGVVDWESEEMVPATTAHHRVWDSFVRNISGGLTILSPAKGQWILNAESRSVLKTKDGVLFEERVIPVRIACTQEDMEKIGKFTLKHYRQVEVMYYAVSDEIHFVRNKELEPV